MIYDIFYVSKDSIADEDWQQFSKRFPLAQKIENVKTFSDIKKKAFTKMFWVVWNDLIIAEDYVNIVTEESDTIGFPITITTTFPNGTTEVQTIYVNYDN